MLYKGPPVTTEVTPLSLQGLTYPSPPHPSIHLDDSCEPSNAILIPSMPSFPMRRGEIEDILDDQIVSTRAGGYQKFLVKWRDCPTSYCTWITMQELQWLNPNLLERYKSRTTPETSASKPRRIDKGIHDGYQVYQSSQKQHDTIIRIIWLGDNHQI